MPLLMVTEPVAVSSPHLTPPFPSVVSLPEFVKPVEQSSVLRRRPPDTTIPPAKVELAAVDVALITGRFNPV